VQRHIVQRHIPGSEDSADASRQAHRVSGAPISSRSRATSRRPPCAGRPAASQVCADRRVPSRSHPCRGARPSALSVPRSGPRSDRGRRSSRAADRTALASSCHGARRVSCAAGAEHVAREVDELRGAQRVPRERKCTRPGELVRLRSYKAPPRRWAAARRRPGLSASHVGKEQGWFTTTTSASIRFATRLHDPGNWRNWGNPGRAWRVPPRRGHERIHRAGSSSPSSSARSPLVVTCDIVELGQLVRTAQRRAGSRPARAWFMRLQTQVAAAPFSSAP